MITKYDTYIKESIKNDFINGIIKNYNLTYNNNDILLNDKIIMFLNFIESYYNQKSYYKFIIFGYSDMNIYSKYDFERILINYLDTMYYLDVDKFKFKIECIFKEGSYYYLYNYEEGFYTNDKNECMFKFFSFLFTNNIILNKDSLNKNIINLFIYFYKKNMDLTKSINLIKDEYLSKNIREEIEAIKIAHNFDLL